MRKVIFEDRTLPWVPFATVAAIAVVFWGSMVWETETIVFPSELAVALFVVLLLLLPLQGRLFWKTDIASLEMTDEGFEGRTSQWIGWGRRVQFAASAARWRGVSDPASKLFVAVGDTEYELNLKSAQRVDREAFRVIDPLALAAAERPTPEPVKAA